jgi:hypothetical protein
MLLLACATLTVLAGTYVFIPLFREPKGDLEVELLAETELDRLLGRKAVAYANLKDLEFEYKMGRLAEADFRRLESGYKGEAAVILQKLDQLGADRNIDMNIERDVAARKNRLSATPPGSAGDTATCPACGAVVVHGKRFCADCGHRLQDPLRE